MCIFTMLKKLLAALLVAGTVFTLAACDGQDKKDPEVKLDSQTEQPDDT